MTFHLPKLPYSTDALAPIMSAETFSFHYEKHHKAYVDKMNTLLADNPALKEAPLEKIVRESKGGLFNNAAQAWNHTFFWHCLAPAKGQKPSGKLEAAINQAFGSFDAFYAKFSESAVSNFGSGWTWLVKNKDGKVAIVNTSNAETPITGDAIPLFVVDVWEHAYYVDYRNARPKFLENFQKIINWDFAAARFDSNEVFNATKEMK